MTKFAQKSFSVAVGSEKYRENFDAVFGKKKESAREARKRLGWKPLAPEQEADNLRDNLEALRHRK